MSYILDALRKADAERESGSVPDLHAQQYVTMLADDEPGRRAGWLIALCGVLAAALVGVLAWAWLGRAAPGDAPAMAVAPAPAIVPPPIGAPVSTGPTPAETGARPALPLAAPSPSPSPLPEPGATPSPAIASRSTTPALPPRVPPGSDLTIPPAPRRKPAITVPARAERSPAALASTTAGPAAPTRPAGDGNGPDPKRIYQPAELPDALRRELPAVNVNGASYSADPSSRILIANGQVLHEGDKLGNGAQLEQIRPRSAVLGFRGYRYEITY